MSTSDDRPESTPAEPAQPDLGSRSEEDDAPERPTVNQPLNAEKRPFWSPLLITIAVFVVLAALYLLGTQVLVSAD